jgi:hypothetical protein
MKNKRIWKRIIIGGAIAVLGVFLGFLLQSSETKLKSNTPFQFGDIQSVHAQDLSLIYLPLILKDYTPLTTLYGIQLDSVTEAGGLSKVSEAKASWVGGIGLSWAAVESTQGVYDWTQLASWEQQMQDVASKGLSPIVNVRYTPTWAQLYDGYICGPMKQEYFDEFATYIRNLVERYSVPPYNVKYWEIWNEEDIDHLLVPQGSGWGCWGDSSDPYYGGGYYAEMLKVVYPQIKLADPQAQVLVGGLLLDCDPRPGAGCALWSHDPKPAKFLEGILKNNGGPYFDGVSFHAYDYYDGELGKYSNVLWSSTWNTTGPVVLAKAQYIIDLLNQNGVQGKFVMNTEAAVLCKPEYYNCNSVFEETKANYVAQVYASAIKMGLKANMWYSLMGWYNSNLLNADLTPRPAYISLQFSRLELRDAAFIRDITTFAGVKGYEFNRGDRLIWVIWSKDGNSHNVSPSSTPLVACDTLGNCTNNPTLPIAVTLQPLYLEFSP